LPNDTLADYEPRLKFSPSAWTKLVLYTTLCPHEIGGFGMLVQDGADYILDDLLLVEQDVNALATHFHGQSVSLLLADLVEQDRDPAALQLWWHSHAREAPFWSGEDEKTISMFRNEGMLSLVSNHEMRLLARFDRYFPRSTTWVHIDRPLEAQEPTSSQVIEARAEISNACRLMSSIT